MTAKRRRHFLAGILGALVLGCAESRRPDPPTIPARGKVLSADGSPFSGGSIEFRSTAPDAPTVLAEIQPDGTFVLQTVFDGRRVNGALAGEYRATVFPPMGTNQNVRPIAVPGTHVFQSGEPATLEIRVGGPAAKQ